MNNTYKIMLLASIVLCGIIVGYYIFQQDTVSDRQVHVDSTATSTDSFPSSNTPNRNTSNTLADPAPIIPTPPPAGTGSTNARPSLMDSVMTHTNNTPAGTLDSNPPARLPDAPAPVTPPSTNRANTTSPVTPDRTATTPLPTNPVAIDHTPVRPVPTNPNNLPDTGRGSIVHNPPTSGNTYTIKSGDNFSTIAEAKLGSASLFQLIIDENPYIDPTKLQIGMVIRLPDASKVAAWRNPGVSRSTPTATGPQEYVVREGDTLSRISKLHYSDPNLWDVIFRANKALIGNDPAGIKPGMKLFIPPQPRITQ